MLSVDALRMLDYQLWLRSGEQAAYRLHCSQSTVSRNNSQTLALFGLSCHRRAGEWQLQGDQGLLLMERRIHQLARVRCGMAPARIEANFWATPAFLEPLPEGWEGGISTHVGMDRPLQLLRERVIDAWIGSYHPDLPDDDPDLALIDLCATPVYLVAAAGHPLEHQADLREEDLSAFPSLALPAGMFPRTEAILRRQGLWRTRVSMRRYRPEFWQGRTEDQVTLSYASCLALDVMPGQVRLDYNLGLTSGEALVVRRDLRDEAPIQKLLTFLQQRTHQLAERHPDLWPTLTLPVAEELIVEQSETPRAQSLNGRSQVRKKALPGGRTS